MEFHPFNPLFEKVIMSKKSLSRIALEAERDGLEEESAIDQTSERLEFAEAELERGRRRTELEESADEVYAADDNIDGEADMDQAESFAIESLHAYGDYLRHQIETGTVTMESIAMVQMGVQNVYASMGVRTRTLAAESAITPAAYAKIVLENLALEAEYAEMGFLGKLGTVMGTIFRKASSTHTLYTQRIEDLRKKYEEKKGTLQPYKLDLASNIAKSWSFFTSEEGGTSHNVFSDMGKNLQLTKYVLMDYAPKALAELEKLVGILASASLQDEESAKRVALAVEKLKHPADLFNQQFLTGEKKPYFGKTGLDMQVGAKRKVLTVGGQNLMRLAELASSKAVRESSTFGHTVKSAANLKFKAESRDFTPNDLDAFLKSAAEFNDLIGHAVQFFQKAEEVTKKAFEVVKGLQGKTAPELKMLANQLAEVVKGFAYAVGTPAKDEQSRAMATTMHCLWMVIDGLDEGEYQGKKKAKLDAKMAKQQQSQAPAPAGEPAAA